ncbi:hypothetical protein [Nocardioides immobilis]|uniref:hypothetical protein n=1 Tax=Nocardioides immobilis TaxID=2049295 RepID=UPI0011C3FD8C|nr:hypothetical protein [Nocardioides immobilis]
MSTSPPENPVPGVVTFTARGNDSLWNVGGGKEGDGSAEYWPPYPRLAESVRLDATVDYVRALITGALELAT